MKICHSYITQMQPCWWFPTPEVAKPSQVPITLTRNFCFEGTEMPTVLSKILETTTNDIQPVNVIKQWVFDSFLFAAEKIEVLYWYLPGKYLQQITLILPPSVASSYYMREKELCQTFNSFALFQDGWISGSFEGLNIRGFIMTWRLPKKCLTSEVHLLE